MATTLEHPPTSSGAASVSEVAPANVCAALSRLAKDCSSRPKLYRESLQVVASYYSSPYATIRITQSTSTLDERVRVETEDFAMWESTAEEVLLESQAENQSIARMYGVEGTPLQVVVLAVPVCEMPDRPIGSMSVIVRCDNASTARVYLGEFAALVSLIASAAGQIGAKKALVAQDDSALKRAVVKASDFQSLHELAICCYE